MHDEAAEERYLLQGRQRRRRLQLIVAGILSLLALSRLAPTAAQLLFPAQPASLTTSQEAGH